MKLRNKMKMLTLAILGVGGLALAGSAAAACPTTPDAWSSVSALYGTASISSTGLDGSACKLDTAITNAAFGFASAYVADSSPSAEPQYRAQFLVDADQLVGLNISQVVRIFAATTSAPTNGVPDLVSLTLYGNVIGTQKLLGIATACASNSTGRCSTAIPITTSGTQRIEIQWTQGATGSLNVWLNNGTEASPNATLSVDNSAWGGVDDADLGLYAASSGYRGSQVNHVVSFDSFDSRRSTFIGVPTP